MSGEVMLPSHVAEERKHREQAANQQQQLVLQRMSGLLAMRGDIAKQIYMQLIVLEYSKGRSDGLRHEDPLGIRESAAYASSESADNENEEADFTVNFGAPATAAMEAADMLMATLGYVDHPDTMKVVAAKAGTLTARDFQAAKTAS